MKMHKHLFFILSTDEEYSKKGVWMKRNRRNIGVFFVLMLILMYGSTQNVAYGIIDKKVSTYTGIRIVLDAGHGGKDEGAQYGGLSEKDLNLEIVLKLKKELEYLGIDVVLTRNNGQDLAGRLAKNRKKEDMKNRMRIINDNKVDLFISIHLNAYADEQVNGIQIFYPKNDDDSKYFASYIQTALTHVDAKQMKMKTGDYYLLNHSRKIGILLECGFLSNPQEREKLADESYQNKLAIAIRKGIVSFIKDVYE